MPCPWVHEKRFREPCGIVRRYREGGPPQSLALGLKKRVRTQGVPPEPRETMTGQVPERLKSEAWRPPITGVPTVRSESPVFLRTTPLRGGPSMGAAPKPTVPGMTLAILGGRALPVRETVRPACLFESFDKMRKVADFFPIGPPVRATSMMHSPAAGTRVQSAYGKFEPSLPPRSWSRRPRAPLSRITHPQRLPALHSGFYGPKLRWGCDDHACRQ